MNKPKEANDNTFTLDDLFQKSLEINNFLKGKTNKPSHDENYYDNLSKFFSREIKLRNSSKNICWEKNNTSNNVSRICLIFNIFIDI
jgi:hypothetical protein